MKNETDKQDNLKRPSGSTPPTCLQENEGASDNKIDFTIQDMMEAFRHGIEFEPTSGDADFINSSTPVEKLPFYEWLSRYHTNAQSLTPNPERSNMD